MHFAWEDNICYALCYFDVTQRPALIIKFDLEAQTTDKIETSISIRSVEDLMAENGVLYAGARNCHQNLCLRISLR
jgi:hypothetical protein